MERKQSPWLTARKAATIFWLISLGMTALQSLVFYHQLRREEENRRQEASQRLVVDLRTLLGQLKNAESDGRGFLITGQPAALEEYRQSEKDVWAAVQAVKEKGQETGELEKSLLESLEQSASLELQELGKAVELRQKNGFDAAVLEVRSGRARELAADLENKVTALRDREEAALAAHTAEEERRIRTNMWMFVAVTAADVLLLGLGYWGMQRYVADRKRTEATLAAARKHAEAANMAKDRVLDTVSHDLRTPLNGVMLWAEILKRGDPENKEAADAICRYVEAQKRLINDLLDASRMERGELRVEKKVVPLAKAVNAAVAALRPAAEERRVRLELDLHLEGVHVLGDAFRLEQVFWNLISNAIKFTPPEGVVTVSGRADGFAEVEVRDSGQGIGPAFLSRVFEAYAQEQRAGRQGLGLGLAIVKQLVEAHGGSVRVESEGEGKGSRFFVKLPLAEATAPAGSSAFTPLTARG
jgi:signal transduction histidine kinase